VQGGFDFAGQPCGEVPQVLGRAPTALTGKNRVSAWIANTTRRLATVVTLTYQLWGLDGSRPIARTEQLGDLRRAPDDRRTNLTIGTWSEYCRLASSLALDPEVSGHRVVTAFSETAGVVRCGLGLSLGPICLLTCGNAVV
jgi:hypothetical protein